MQISTLLLFACYIQLIACSASAQNFDTTLLRGEWAEGQSPEVACSENKVRIKLELSSDEKTLEFKLNQPVSIENQLSIDKFSAKVHEATNSSLAIEFFDLGGSPIPKGENDTILLTFFSEGVYSSQPKGMKSPLKITGYRCN